MKRNHHKSLIIAQNLFKFFFLHVLGLWLRSVFLKGSRSHRIYYHCKLSHLCPFFSMGTYFPMRNQISLDLSLRQDSQILIAKDGATNGQKFKLVVEEIELHLAHGIFDGRIREKWLNAINNSGLCRNLQVDKQSFFSLKKDQQSCRFVQ